MRSAVSVFTNEAFKVLNNPTGRRILLHAEHASMRMPAPYSWSANDRRLVNDHWSVDLGSEDLCTDLVQSGFASHAVLARFTRILLDCNRAIGDETMFRTHADHIEIDINRNISEGRSLSIRTRHPSLVFFLIWKQRRSRGG